MRKDYATGSFTQKMLSVRYGVNPTNVHYVVTRRAWKYVM